MPLVLPDDKKTYGDKYFFNAKIGGKETEYLEISHILLFLKQKSGLIDV